MAILSKMYFNAVFGALGGLLGWMLFGIFGDRLPETNVGLHLNPLLGGALIGGMIGYFVVSVEAIRDRSFVRFARLSSYGFLIGAVGGAIGMYIGDLINSFFVYLAGNVGGLQLPLTMLARGLGWSLLGIAIGGSEGIAARALGKFSYGTIGGLLGGFIGGVLFEVFIYLSRQAAVQTYAGNAFGLVILGACIGSLSALVQTVFLPANLKVLRGWQEGREYPLDKPAVLIGRDEHADIALFRDMKIEKKHCVIKIVQGRFVLINNGAAPEWTLVNDAPLAAEIELKDGDRIQLGNVVLRFQHRAAVHRASGRAFPRGATSGT